MHGVGHRALPHIVVLCACDSPSSRRYIGAIAVTDPRSLESGVKKGDIVVSINGTKPDSPEHAVSLLAAAVEAAPTGSIAIELLRLKHATWMLMDGVGKWGVNYDYYLKYRHKESEKSGILGCVNLKKDDDYMWCALPRLARYLAPASLAV